MTIALQSHLRSPSQSHFLIKLNYRLLAPFQRIWWHTHAYAIIVGVMMLAGLSFIGLFVYDKLTQALTISQRNLQSSKQIADLSVSAKQRH